MMLTDHEVLSYLERQTRKNQQTNPRIKTKHKTLHSVQLDERQSFSYSGTIKSSLCSGEQQDSRHKV